MRKGETAFRTDQVDPFLKTLENCVDESIQQTSIRGTFDKILCIQGWYIGAEIKDEDGKLDPLQKYKASLIRTKGKGIALCWRPQNHELVKHFLSQLNAGIFDKALLRKINQEEEA